MISYGYLDHIISMMNDETDKLWFIVYLTDDATWYFSDLKNESAPYSVIWVRNIASAFKFTSRESAEDFAADCVSPRKYHIVSVPVELVWHPD
jgi:hypothetical protein